LLWAVTPHSTEIVQHFRGAFLWLKGKPSKEHQNVSFLPVAGFSFDLLLDLKYADDIFLRSTVLSPKYTVCHRPEKCSLHGIEYSTCE
jgi:hypothetical protein